MEKTPKRVSRLCIFSSVSNFEDNNGTTVKATNKEHKIAKHKVKAIGPNKIDASPSVIIIGTNTAKTVVVAAITALPTSEVPAKAASVDDVSIPPSNARIGAKTTQIGRASCRERV